MICPTNNHVRFAGRFSIILCWSTRYCKRPIEYQSTHVNGVVVRIESDWWLIQEKKGSVSSPDCHEEWTNDTHKAAALAMVERFERHEAETRQQSRHCYGIATNIHSHNLNTNHTTAAPSKPPKRIICSSLANIIHSMIIMRVTASHSSIITWNIGRWEMQS